MAVIFLQRTVPAPPASGCSRPPPNLFSPVPQDPLSVVTGFRKKPPASKSGLEISFTNYNVEKEMFFRKRKLYKICERQTKLKGWPKNIAEAFGLTDQDFGYILYEGQIVPWQNFDLDEVIAEDEHASICGIVLRDATNLVGMEWIKELDLFSQGESSLIIRCIQWYSDTGTVINFYQEEQSSRPRQWEYGSFREALEYAVRRSCA